MLLGAQRDVQASLSNQTGARILPVRGAQSRKLVHVSSLAPGEAALTATDEGLHHHRTATATVRACPPCQTQGPSRISLGALWAS